MKNKFIVAFLIATLIASCAKKNQEFAELTFTNEINFGKIKVNDTVNKKFKLKNTSNTTLNEISLNNCQIWLYSFKLVFKII